MKQTIIHSITFAIWSSSWLNDCTHTILHSITFVIWSSSWLNDCAHTLLTFCSFFCLAPGDSLLADSWCVKVSLLTLLEPLVNNRVILTVDVEHLLLVKLFSLMLLKFILSLYGRMECKTNFATKVCVALLM